MKFNPFRFIFFTVSVILLSSCLGTNNPVATSSDPSFVSLTFAANDSVPFLNTAVFTLVNNNIITNVDSLPFKTKIDSVLPTFTFKSTLRTRIKIPSVYEFKNKKDSIILAGNDTIDFRQTLQLRNYASDGIHYADYDVVTNVHHVDPELYQWFKVSDNLNTVVATSQKTVILNDTLFYYQNDGTNAYLYTSANGSNWNQATVSGLPVNTPLNDMVQFNGKLFLTQDGFNIYSSTDGFNWTKNTASSFTFQSLLFVLNGQLWAVVQSNTDSNFHFATSSDGTIWSMTNGTIPVNFPVRDFASVSYKSSTGKPKVLVTGGHSSTGSPLVNNWSSEDGAFWVDFSTENHTLDTLAVGASVISYDSKLFVLGLRNDMPDSTYYRVSKDDGLSWQIPDTLRNFMPKGFPARTYESMVVLKPRDYNKSDAKTVVEQSNRIFIIGGISSGTTRFSDVWTGKLNRKNFLIQEPTIYVNK